MPISHLPTPRQPFPCSCSLTLRLERVFFSPLVKILVSFLSREGLHGGIVYFPMITRYYEGNYTNSHPMFPFLLQATTLASEAPKLHLKLTLKYLACLQAGAKLQGHRGFIGGRRSV